MLILVSKSRWVNTHMWSISYSAGTKSYRHSFRHKRKSQRSECLILSFISIAPRAHCFFTQHQKSKHWQAPIELSGAHYTRKLRFVAPDSVANRSVSIFQLRRSHGLGNRDNFKTELIVLYIGRMTWSLGSKFRRDVSPLRYIMRDRRIAASTGSIRFTGTYCVLYKIIYAPRVGTHLRINILINRPSTWIEKQLRECHTRSLKERKQKIAALYKCWHSVLAFETHNI